MKVNKNNIWDITVKEIEKDIKRGKNLECILDVAFAQFYFAGQFDNNIPVEGGRKVCAAIIKHFKNHETK